VEACDEFNDVVVKASCHVYAFVRYGMDQFDDDDVLVIIIAETSVERFDLVTVVFDVS